VDGVQTCSDLSGDNYELCNGVDDDCNPGTSENADNDGDGISACAGDCNDGDPTIYPGAEEICDGIDNDCDPTTDHDGDSDGYRDCEGDCAPMNPAIHPGADEICNDGLDNDCNGYIDGADPMCGGSAFNPDETGCSCATMPGEGSGAGWLVAILALFALRRRRR
jgi:MYXO-CTERM domain-containing protein